MAKGYWVVIYRSVSDPARLAEYAKLAGPAIEAGGGRFLARGTPAKVFEAGSNQRLVVTEFDSVAQAIAAYESPAYQAAMRVLKGAVDREIRIMEGVQVQGGSHEATDPRGSPPDARPGPRSG
jgi:uncharacterized protein (DUF1330 family)